MLLSDPVRDVTHRTRTAGTAIDAPLTGCTPHDVLDAGRTGVMNCRIVMEVQTGHHVCLVKPQGNDVPGNDPVWGD